MARWLMVKNLCLDGLLVMLTLGRVLTFELPFRRPGLRIALGLVLAPLWLIVPHFCRLTPAISLSAAAHWKSMVGYPL